MEHERDPRQELSSIMLEPEPGAGSLVLHAEVADIGRQVEVEGTEGRLHAIVRTLRSGSGTQQMAVFPSLAAGSYGLVSSDGTLGGRTVTIRDGQVTESSLN
jgi:hypothetical protein